MKQSTSMLIIGITGTLGAGKGTVVDYLVEKKDYDHYSVRAFLLEEIRRRGMPENRDSMVLVANELRASHGPSYVTDQLYDQAAQIGKNCIIESIRTPGEITSLRKQKSFYLFAVDALPAVRYQRIHLRKSETDQVSYMVFLGNEEREMTSTDPNKQNLAECIRQADFVFENNRDKEHLFAQVEMAIAKITG